MGISSGLAGTVGAVPVGSVTAFAGSSAPSGWLLCYGQAIDRTQYSGLFAVISTTYGSGDGSTTFNLPDMRGRVAAGKDDMGGSAASRLTSGTSGITGSTLGAAGGNEAMHSHSHSNSLTDPGHSHSVGPRTLGDAGSSEAGTPDFVRSVFSRVAADSYSTQWRAFNAYSNVTITNASAGAGSSQNVQPTIVLNYIIKAQ